MKPVLVTQIQRDRCLRTEDLSKLREIAVTLRLRGKIKKGESCY